MTYFVSSGTLNPAQSSSVQFQSRICSLALLCLVTDDDAVVYYLREDQIWSQNVSRPDGQVGSAVEVRNNSGTIRAFDIDYNRRLLYWIDDQNKVPLTVYDTIRDAILTCARKPT